MTDSTSNSLIWEIELDPTSTLHAHKTVDKNDLSQQITVSQASSTGEILYPLRSEPTK